jgi:hypothetical protein
MQEFTVTITKSKEGFFINKNGYAIEDIDLISALRYALIIVETTVSNRVSTQLKTESPTSEQQTGNKKD